MANNTPNTIPIDSIVVPFSGLYLGSHKVIPQRNYCGTYGYAYHRAYADSAAPDEPEEVLASTRASRSSLSMWLGLAR